MLRVPVDYLLLISITIAVVIVITVPYLFICLSIPLVIYLLSDDTVRW